MYAVPWVLTGLSIWAVGLRVYLPRKLSRTVDADDWVMAAAVLFQIAYQVLVTMSVIKGAGKTLPPTFTPDNLIDLLKWSWFSNPLAILVSVTARVSIAILLVRIFGIRTWFKWFMIVFTSMVVIIGILNIVIVWFQAHPVQALWDFRIPVPHWSPMIQQTFSSILHVGLSLVLALSIITFGIALAKLVLIIGAMSTATDVQGDTADVFYIFSVLTLISGVEQNLVIIIGCAPKLRTITKVKPTFFSFFGSELRSLLRRTKGTPDTSLTPGSKPHHSDYSDLELQPHLRFDQIHQREALAVRNQVPGMTGQEHAGNNIHRRDDFTITNHIQT
ncbi:hypothetical protein SLS62_011422, partial [Diatrype stigma]